MKWLGIDVGGANLKASYGGQKAVSKPFELWKHPHKLGDALGELVAAVPGSVAIAATMTGELADCYETKADGVRHITQALKEAAGVRRLAVYCVDGWFRTADEVCQSPISAAASNWHALARFAARFLPSNAGLLVDIGTTTTDIIPILDGNVATPSQTDCDRLLAGELVYTGVERTPVCALVHTLPFRGSDCPVAAELFATTADAYCVLERGGDANRGQPGESTADGRPLIKRYAIDRLARQICADRDSFSESDAVCASRAIEQRQFDLVSQALGRVVDRLPGVGAKDSLAVVVSGSGEFLADKITREMAGRNEIVSLSNALGHQHSSAAAAHAVATLAAEADRG